MCATWIYLLTCAWLQCSHGLLLVYNVVFILRYTDGEVLGYNARVIYGFIVVIDEGNGLGSFFGSTGACNNCKN